MQMDAADHLWRLERRDRTAHLPSTETFEGECVSTVNTKDVLHPTSRLQHHCNLNLDEGERL